MRVLLLLAALLAFPVLADTHLTETRYCGTPARNADGSIKRSSAVTRAFQRIHPCPSTGLRYGPCPYWFKNHDIPLACGGCDSVSNMSWMSRDVKRLVDFYERRINGATPPFPGTEHICTNAEADSVPPP